MPKVICHTPAWLSRPNPGFDLFMPKTPARTSNGTRAMQDEQKRPSKAIATRDNTEVFVAVGNEVRWADLTKLKEDHESIANLGSSRSQHLASLAGKSTYRVLKLPIHYPISQLALSPSGDYMAVATSHTVHVVLLPDSTHLESSDDAAPLKPKTFQVGPTAHVLEESPIASLLWHPLGYHGRCLVTITREGVVRLWEINRSDRSTFNEPSLSIDLKKLANAINDEENLSASKYGAPKGFSPDSFELEVASACFGDFPDQEGVHGWAPMTLWIAMVEGEVYALCPLLPKKWQLKESPGASTFLQTLATSINTNYAEVHDDPEATLESQATANKQLSWLSDIVYNESVREEPCYGEPIKVYSRPTNAPACPLLQGPFSLTPEVEEFELSDIIAFSLKTFSDGTADEPAEGVPAAVVCLLTDTSQVLVCLDLEGIVGRWLPSSSNQYALSDTPDHTFAIVEIIALGGEGDAPSFNQCFTPDVHTDFSFYVSRTSGVFYISLEPWIRKLENELSEPEKEGAEFRSRLLFEGASTLVETCINKPTEEVTSCVAIENGNIGYLLLTIIGQEPCAVIFDAPEDGLPNEEEIKDYLAIEGPVPEIRPVYQAPKELYAPSQVAAVLDQVVPSRHKALLKEEVRLSPANLELLMTVHKVLSQETHRLGLAVSDLFRRCERLQDEFKNQIFRTAQLSTRIDSITGEDEVPSDNGSDAFVYGNAKIEDRLEKVKTRQKHLNARYEAIRKKMVNVGGPDLSEKESDWIEELQTMDRSLEQSAERLTDDQDGSAVPAWQRLEHVKTAKVDLTVAVEKAAKDGKEKQAQKQAPGGVKVPSQSRRQENEHIEALLQRESDLVEAATNRLRSMGISIPEES
ncbi:uncharacterized protein BDR25DRAFT_326220 [Lindgomyces ingoldianus]|uniref:Uncharacterized protein n=1 Tax=Lindgomyces ingoldianus TaxID=673940 RepID=A0ACB6QT78_9PLEO|nr:uncharacterized protein BDR25DRAFT_326220 [Lindgomyces ingoldianus]KAF2469371.1 hypothetical protein BDR25DRAFT_326220 [Lindgomyces ingoldianus]